MFFSDSIIDEARGLARSILASGQVSMPILTNAGTEIACVSRDRKVVTGLVCFEESGITFYLGQRLGK